jgi:hypothetical protein
MLNLKIKREVKYKKKKNQVQRSMMPNLKNKIQVQKKFHSDLAELKGIEKKS